METIKLQSGIVYGPVDSRRFGKSLGINVLPEGFKVCSFDCVYCQYHDESGKPKFPDFLEIYTQLLVDFERVRDSKVPVDWIMISGNGEPTLHPELADIIDGLLTVRELYFPKTPIGILSNSSTCHKKEIREALSRLDGRFMKLDAGSLYVFHDVNRPYTTLAWGDVIEGLSSLPDVTIQSLFVAGKVNNTTDRAVDDWIETVKCIRPREVQIYTVERNPQDADIFPVEEEKLRAISDKLRVRTLIPSTVYF